MCMPQPETFRELKNCQSPPPPPPKNKQTDLASKIQKLYKFETKLRANEKFDTCVYLPNR